jgi:hypothetical protein
LVKLVIHTRGSSRPLSAPQRPSILVSGMSGISFGQTTRTRDDEYFVLGDNRSYTQDSRDFGPVPRKAIFSRVILIWSPVGRFGPVGYDKKLTPPGPVSCN